MGFATNESKAKRAEACHKAYVELVERCATETQDPDVTAVLNFLRNDPLSRVDPSDDFDPSGIISFRVQGRITIDKPEVQTFWSTANSNADAPTMQCLSCGNERAGTEPAPIKNQGNPRRTVRRHFPDFGKCPGFRVLRTCRIPHLPHVRQLRRRVHQGHKRPARRQPEQIRLRRKRNRILDKRATGVQFPVRLGGPLPHTS